MIIEPEKYFQYKIPKLHTLWNGKNRDFSHQAIAGYQHFISAYQDKKLVVLITEATKDKLQAYYNSKTIQNDNAPLLELSHAGRWYANGFISAYNFCEQYEKEHPAAKVDFALYADNLEQTNETQSPSNNGHDHGYIINVGRIEGVRFYLKEQRLSNNIGNTIQSPLPQAGKSMEEKALMFNSTGLTLGQNLKPASTNQRVIRAIEDILERHKGKKSARTIVGYCIIAIKGLVKEGTTDKILTAAFKNDYFPEDDIDKFSSSIYRVLRSYSKKTDSMTVLNPDEQWGEQKETILQDVKTQIRKAISNL